MYHIASLSAGNLHFLIGVFLHFITGADMEASVFPGITEMVEFALCATPLTVERETGNAHGAITGWSFTNNKLPAESRFRKIASSIKTPIEDVYQCGQWTFSPSGLPVSILTGKLAADAIHKTLKVCGS